MADVARGLHHHAGDQRDGAGGASEGGDQGEDGVHGGSSPGGLVVVVEVVRST
ncbi:hypothetical protein HN358_00810 [Candidatus Uhrbacteria bacterium]|jgi:hypothetical protein|nr:hypothetical protein [Candidatus Uhrbacteria bacterium]MBT7717426.1 hypothetical protein [Candidatus Uhrbacteria bacterium]